MQQFGLEGKQNKVIMDYCLDDIDIPEHALPLHRTIIGTFEKFIKVKVNLNLRKEMIAILNDFGAVEIQADGMKDVEFQLNGNNLLFPHQGRCPVNC